MLLFWFQLVLRVFFLTKSLSLLRIFYDNILLISRFYLYGTFCLYLRSFLSSRCCLFHCLLTELSLTLSTCSIFRFLICTFTLATFFLVSLFNFYPDLFIDLLALHLHLHHFLHYFYFPCLNYA